MKQPSPGHSDEYIAVDADAVQELSQGVDDRDSSRDRHDGRGEAKARGPATNRLEAFSDAVFAIAITLLALNLQVPDLNPVTPHALVASLGAKWPTYLSFLLSFVTLLIAWVYHHRLLQGARHAGTSLLFSNGALLLVVSSLPFPTALLGSYLTTPAASVVAAIYAGYLALLNLTYNLLWWVVVRQQRGGQQLSGRPLISRLIAYLGFPSYLIAAGLAFWSPIATLVICGVWWVVWTVTTPTLAPED